MQRRFPTAVAPRLTWRTVVGGLACCLSACSQPTDAPAAAPTLVPSPATSQFANPVIDEDFPDPDVLVQDNTYYAFATNVGGAHIRSARSADLVHWQILKDALPLLPLWAQPNFTWAPEVSSGADAGTYVMYFTARHTSGKQCIGVATSDSPERPFKSPDQTPLICQIGEGGSIDPEAFVDADHSRYILWKNDGNCCGMATFIYIQPVSSDGLRLQGNPTRLITADQSWEGPLVEAPTLLQRGSMYYLFYSANRYDGPSYAIGYAVSNSILGPYHKPAGTPLVASTSAIGSAAPVIGPGGQDVVAGRDGRTWLLYHAWDPTLSYRGMNVDELVWNGDTPVVKAPTRAQQPAP